MKHNKLLLFTTGALLSSGNAFWPTPRYPIPGREREFRITPRQLPADPIDIQSLTTPNGATITYKEPGKEGICETTPGVGSYAGYVNLGPDWHSFVCCCHHHLHGSV